MSTIFGKIVKGELPCEKVYENAHLIAIKDIAPVAPVHILIIPKKEIADLQSLKGSDMYLLEEIVKAAQKIAEQLEIDHGYRLVCNSGPEAGQTIFHLHFHLIGGRRLTHLG